MRHAAFAALVLAALCACSPGPTHIVVDPEAGGIPIGGGTRDGGDGGSDAGDGGSDAGDGGHDAGCAPLTLNGVPAVDGCFGSASVTATGTVNAVNCSLEITLNDSTGPCVGTVSGPHDAFDGGCQGGFFRCTSPSLPGTLTCIYGTAVCAIVICDAGAACP